MEELQQQIAEPAVEQGEERHPADTLNDGDPHKFFLFIPAFLLHTFIAVVGTLFVAGLVTRLLWLNQFVLRSPWSMLVFNYVLCMAMGVAWSPFLDRWLYRTSRFVWIPAALLFSIWFGSWLLEFGLKVALGMFFSGRRMPFLESTLPLLSSGAYAVGAWVRRSTGDEIPLLVESATMAIGASKEEVPAKKVWAKVVELWRAGRRA
jgi:hypothetical protein